MDHREFAQKVLADTGKTVYEVELEVAMNWYWTHRPTLAADAWNAAGEFIGAMKRIYEGRYDRERQTISD